MGLLLSNSNLLLLHWFIPKKQVFRTLLSNFKPSFGTMEMHRAIITDERWMSRDNCHLWLPIDYLFLLTHNDHPFKPLTWFWVDKTIPDDFGWMNILDKARTLGFFAEVQFLQWHLQKTKIMKCCFSFDLLNPKMGLCLIFELRKILHQ